jgi:hypothetical protein
MTPLLAISAQSLAVTVGLIALLELAKCTDWFGPPRKTHFFGLPVVGVIRPKPRQLPSLDRGRSPSRHAIHSSSSRCSTGQRPNFRSTITTKTSSSL